MRRIDSRFAIQARTVSQGTASGTDIRAWVSRPANRDSPEIAPAQGVGTLEQKHIPALDGLRGVAVLLILIFHFHFIFSPQSSAEAFLIRSLDFGWCGVNLFFALSGFLITGILLDTRTTKHFFTIFYVRRALRIFPLYYSFLVFIFLLNQAHYFSAAFRSIPTDWGWYVLYLQNMFPVTNIRLSHLWSLAVEEQFYLFWPAFVFWVPLRRLIPAGIAIVVCCLALRCFMVGTGIGAAYAFTSVFTRLDELVLGALVAVVVRDPVLRKRASTGVWAPIALGLLGLAAVVFNYRLMDAIGLSSMGLLFSSCVFLVVRSSGAIARFFSLRWLRSVGKYGYGIYVLHPTLFAATSGPLKHALADTSLLCQLLVKTAYIPVMIVASYFAGKLSWVLLESRFNRLKRFFPYYA